jgi:hypothetical protein
LGEDKYIVAQANVELDAEGNITTDLVNARQAGNFVLKNREEIDYIDVSPKQLVSVAGFVDSLSWKTTTPTAHSWVQICSVRQFLCSVRTLPTLEPAWRR